MMHMPENPEDIRTWIDETLRIAQHPIYINDEGAVSCNDINCKCNGEPFGDAIPGRRHTLECLVEEVARHRRQYGPTQADGYTLGADTARKCCRNMRT